MNSESSLPKLPARCRESLHIGQLKIGVVRDSFDGIKRQLVSARDPRHRSSFHIHGARVVVNTQALLLDSTGWCSHRNQNHGRFGRRGLGNKKTFPGLGVNHDSGMNDVADMDEMVAGAGPADGNKFRRRANSQSGFDCQGCAVATHAGAGDDGIGMNVYMDVSPAIFAIRVPALTLRQRRDFAPKCSDEDRFG